ncbi:MAG: arylsulfatase [Parasphingorhabdus sp.]|uniref:arylsulfatase B n=2 Tax=Parasphingorhabdus sp. TaxID=2709688 RepID=UPI00326586C4
MKRATFLVLGILVVAGIAAYFYYGDRSPSSTGFSNETTANLAGLVKQRTSSEPPNVIIIMADDLGWGDVGYHGSDIETPNIDRLAREGMRLERFYALPVCTPTRSALMTGRDPIKLGMANAGIMPWNDGGVALDEHFMPESFREAGYETAMVGKWHLGHTIEQHTPNARGFDHFYGHLNTQVHYFDHSFAKGYDFQENGKTVRHDGEYATDVHGDQTVRYLKQLRDKSKPFFLYVPFIAPHSPMIAKQEDMDKYPRRLDLPASPKKTYAAMVDNMDQAIGRILDTLDEQGIADNTIVLFFSDNGGFSAFGASNGSLRGGKTETFEGGIRVAAVMRWPEVLPANSVNDAVISVMDLLPTLTGAAGVKAGNVKELDGTDRWDAVIGKGANQRAEPLYFTSNSPVYNSFMHGVLDGKWKLVQRIDHQRRSTDVESMLFDVYADPGEQTDLADRYPEQVERLTISLDARLAEHPVGGVYVQVMPHPGWRAPLDYADAIIAADKINDEPHAGFGSIASKVLQSRYGDKGKILYD